MKGKTAFKKYMLLEIIIVFAVLAFDILLKRYAVENLQGSGRVTFISGILNLVYVENRGASFGMLQGKLWLFLTLTVIALAAFLVFLYKKRDGHLLLRLSLALIIAGTVGNFIDRVKAGYVVDMLEFGFFDFPVFNIADSALTVGVTLFAIYYLFIYKEPKKVLQESGQNSQQEPQQRQDNGYGDGN